MFFLTNLYERRLNDNMRRHALDAKVAPHKPKPSTRGCPIRQSSFREQKGADQEILNRFLEANQSSITMAAVVQPPSPPPTYQNVVKEPKYQLVDAQFDFDGKPLKSFEVKKPAAAFVQKPMARSGSMESTMFTDSDAASNVSFPA